MSKSAALHLVTTLVRRRNALSEPVTNEIHPKIRSDMNFPPDSDEPRNGGRSKRKAKLLKVKKAGAKPESSKDKGEAHAKYRDLKEKTPRKD